MAYSVVALAGGVGGAKLADGLARFLPPGSLSVIVNTGDDFTHYGLSISPDLDTVMYTLGGVAHPVNGWGLEGDTQLMLGMMRQYGDPGWFGLGDKDLATHLLRTQWLGAGLRLTEVTDRLSAALGIRSAILPLSDEPAPTMVDTVEHGWLPFQEYFVRLRWQPVVRSLRITTVPGTPEAEAALRDADLIVICPSNPVLSVRPILQAGKYREMIQSHRVPCIAVSPLIGGKAVKGPAAKLMQELSMEPTAQGTADYYGDLIDGFVVDNADQVSGPRVLKTDILMRHVGDRIRLASEVIEWVRSWNR